MSEPCHAETVKRIGAMLSKHRCELEMSLKQLEKVGALLYRETGVKSGLSYKTQREKEKNARDLSERLYGDLKTSVAFLLEKLQMDADTKLALVLCSDGYKVFNAFRGKKRRRLACGLLDRESGRMTRLITVMDAQADSYTAWLAREFYSQLDDLCKRTFEVETSSGRIVSATIARVLIGGDHHELWSLFKGVGGGSAEQRCCFCTTKAKTRDQLENLHQCKRLSAQEMTAAGRECTTPEYCELKTPTGDPVPVYVITPPLHDFKGVTRLLVDSLPQGPAAKNEVTKSANMTGRQARSVLKKLRRRSSGAAALMCRALEALVSFRYADVFPRFVAGNKAAAKAVAFALVSYHMLVVGLQWCNDGVVNSQFLHSMGHGFDLDDAVPIELSDEAHERCNGARKRYARNSSPQTLQTDLQLFELLRQHVDEDLNQKPAPRLRPFEFEESSLLKLDSIRLCHCVLATNELWSEAADNLNKRLEELGLGAYAGPKESCGSQTFRGDSNETEDGRCITFCLCNEKKWKPPKPAKDLLEEEVVSTTDDTEDDDDSDDSDDSDYSGDSDSSHDSGNSDDGSDLEEPTVSQRRYRCGQCGSPAHNRRTCQGMIGCCFGVPFFSTQRV